jgi:hypothetical protein
LAARCRSGSAFAEIAAVTSKGLIAGIIAPPMLATYYGVPTSPAPSLQTLIGPFGQVSTLSCTEADKPSERTRRAAAERIEKLIEHGRADALGSGIGSTISRITSKCAAE